MPLIETSGDWPEDLIRVRSVMHWPGPDDEEARHQFFVVEAVRAYLSDHNAPSIELPVSTIQTLLAAPSTEELKKQRAKSTKTGMLAGMVLIFMFLMDRYSERLPSTGAAGASLNKAFTLTAGWASDGTTWGDGSPMPRSDKTVQHAWRDFGSVAHLWAALEMNRITPYGPKNELTAPEHFPSVLETAAYLQTFAKEHLIDNKAGKSKEPLLDPSKAWLLDTRRHEPKMRFHHADDAFDNAPWRVMLRQYRS
jgi:hypothetical protein